MSFYSLSLHQIKIPLDKLGTPLIESHWLHHWQDCGNVAVDIAKKNQSLNKFTK